MQPLLATAAEENSTIMLTGPSTVDVKLQYKLNNNNWQNYVLGQVITLENIDDYVIFINLKNNFTTDFIFSENCFQFKMTGKIKMSGSVHSLINNSETLNDNTFAYLFQNCSSLIQAPEFPLMNQLSQYCYYHMFQGCTNLTAAPVLPTVNLNIGCYSNMFKNCTSLTGVHSLPGILSTNSAAGCYSNMFQNCTSLIKAPEILGTQFGWAITQLNQMFKNCSNLKEITVHFSQYNAQSNLYNWVEGVASSGTFYKPKDFAEVYSSSDIPPGWTPVNID